MFGYLIKKLHLIKILTENASQNSNISPTIQNLSANLSPNLDKNLRVIKDLIGKSYDLIIRDFVIGQPAPAKAALIYLNGMTDHAMINESVLKPLMLETRLIENNQTISKAYDLEMIRSTLLSAGEVNKSSSFDNLVDGCLSGETILLLDGCSEALRVMTASWDARNVEDPKTESVVRGPREGFTENLLTNSTLIRRKIKHQDLTLEAMKIGRHTKTTVCIVYIKGVANPSLIEEIKRRLSEIKTDSILESGYIEQFIEDNPFSIFSTVANSEKPDIVAAKILEGRAAIIVDGTPFVLTVPMLLVESFQSAEDYYSRPYFASLIRLIRFLSFGISVLGPATYVALTTFHQELIPTSLLFSMAAAQEGVPFPAVMEALTMGIVFEILREAGVRLPRPVGQAVSIVGALVIGQSAVTAGLIGSPMVIVVALTAVSSFVVPAQTDSGGILRIVFVLMAGFLGGYGVMITLIAVYLHLSSLRSFGTPFLSPLSPLTKHDLIKDSFIRTPIWTMLNRPRTISWRDSQRQEFRLKPSPPDEEDLSSE